MISGRPTLKPIHPPAVEYVTTSAQLCVAHHAGVLRKHPERRHEDPRARVAQLKRDTKTLAGFRAARHDLLVTFLNRCRTKSARQHGAFVKASEEATRIVDKSEEDRLVPYPW